MSNFNDVFKYEGEDFDYYKNLPTLVFNYEDEVEDYAEEVARENIYEDYTDMELDKLSKREWNDLLADYIDDVKEDEFDTLLNDRDSESINDDIYNFERTTGIPVSIDRRRYGELQVIVEDEDALTEEELMDTKRFFNKLKNKYNLTDRVDLRSLHFKK